MRTSLLTAAALLAFGLGAAQAAPAIPSAVATPEAGIAEIHHKPGHWKGGKKYRGYSSYDRRHYGWRRGNHYGWRGDYPPGYYRNGYYRDRSRSRSVEFRFY